MKLFYYICITFMALTVVLSVFGIRESNPALMYRAFESAIAAVVFYSAAEPAKQLWIKIRERVDWVDFILFLPIIILVVYAFAH